MAVFMGSIFIVLFSLLLIWTVKIALSALKTNQWHTANGQVVSSRIDVTESISAGNNRKRRKNYTPVVEYHYTVRGSEYTSARVIAYFSAKLSYTTQWQANRVITRYPEGKRVLVFYDPQDPAFSCLEPGVPWGMVLFLSLFSLIGIGVGIALMLYIR